jgi:AAR2 protein
MSVDPNDTALVKANVDAGTTGTNSSCISITGTCSRNVSTLLSVLDLPIGSVINIDGVTITLQRSDFVGVHSLPTKVCDNTTTTGNASFHLLAVRGGPRETNVARHESIPSGVSAITVGLLFLQNHNDDQMLVRRYDNFTEEVSSIRIDDATLINLMDHVQNNSIDPHQLISYRDIVSSTYERSWYQLTCYITPDFLKRRNLVHGTKLIPSAYSTDDDPNSTSNNDCHSNDGIEVHYPPIPLMSRQNKSNMSRHLGTRKFLQSLTPSERTSLCLATSDTSISSKSMDRNHSKKADNHRSVSNFAFDYIVDKTYAQQWNYLLGDLQLSYLLFLHLQCYSSWIHWRDLIALLSFVDTNGMQRQVQLYEALFNTVSVQIDSIDDEGVFSDVGLADDECFLLPSLQQLIRTSNILARTFPENDFTVSLRNLRMVLQRKFPSHFGSNENSFPVEENIIDSENFDRMIRDENDFDCNGVDDLDDDNQDDDDDDDDDDAPVVVSTEEIEESVARSQQHLSESSPSHLQSVSLEDRESIRTQYPLLMAAKDSCSVNEDILMTCARVLYDAVDVSLVREASAYLENVEANKETLFS